MRDQLKSLLDQLTALKKYYKDDTGLPVNFRPKNAFN